MPSAMFTLVPGGFRTPDGAVLPLVVNLPGDVNRGNAVFAIAAASVLGVDPASAAVRIAAVRSVDGRYSIVDLGGRPARVFLAKNPAGWAAALSMIDDGGPLAIGINARVADGTDTSWLYDVPFEQLAGRTIGAFGDRRSDLAVRLHYAGAFPIVEEDPVVLAARLGEGRLTVAANYTAFRDLRRHEMRELQGPAGPARQGGSHG
jgi:UDP-N-acetylmuramyl tripeptide synthase